jgi:hypothetical protein
MTALRLLPVTPIPHSDETYDGYIVRLTSMNGYYSYHDLERDQKNDYSKKNIRPSPHDIHILSGHDVNELAGAPGTTSYKVNGILISTIYFNPAAICPDCIATAEYQQAKYCHPLMAACLTHERVLITHCTCRRPVSYIRRDLGVCKCGMPYSKIVTPKFGPATWEMIKMSYLALKLAEASCLHKDRPLPYHRLLPLTHEQLYNVINQFGQLFAALENRPPSLDGTIQAYLIVDATDVLHEWPTRFYMFIDKLYRANLNSDRFSDFREQYHCEDPNIHKPLWNIPWVREAHLTYLKDDWRVSKEFRPKDHRGDQGLISAAILIRAFVDGESIGTVKNGILQKKYFLAKKLMRNGEPRLAIPLPDHEKKQTAYPGLTKTQAAKRLGITVKAMKYLSDEGYILFHHLAPKKDQLCVEDIHSLLSYFRSLAQATSLIPSHLQLITLESACQGKQEHCRLQATLLSDAMLGRIKVYGTFESLDQIHFDKADVLNAECRLKAGGFLMPQLMGWESRCIREDELYRLRSSTANLVFIRNYEDLLA